MQTAKRSKRRIVITEFVARRPKALIAGAGVSLFAVISAAKFVSGPEFVFSAMYLVPVMFMTWFLSVFAGVMIAASSIAVLLFVNLAEPHKYLHAIVPYWNAGMDAGVFLIVILIVAEAKQLYERERDLSREDFVTGLQNSRAFSEALAKETRRMRRYPHQITIVYIDLDNFKQVNDRFGHDVGDLLLSTVADALRSNVRDVDTVARLGGDEFALLLPETDSDSAQRVLNKVKAAIHEYASSRLGYAISFSAGAVTFARPLDSSELMIQRADRLMYSVKQHGKGDVVHETVA
jgi:diguanylate cyclase (GGDEF)-like protein